MKKLYLCRHAKSSWSFDLNDFDRPLGERGRRDVLKVGHYLKRNHKKPDLIITSPASRAFYTALFLADAWGYPEENIVLNKDFYHGSEETMIQQLSSLTSQHSVAVFGHNPGFSSLAYQLSGKTTEDMPTGSVIGLHFKMDSWREIKEQRGELFLFLKPKTL